MSTSAQLSPAWKQEVNRRVAEHRGRKGGEATQPVTGAENQHGASRRAAEAAARVAARYANAPSYGEMLANEARAALRAAEAASLAALHAQAAAKSVLAGLEAAEAAEAAMSPMPHAVAIEAESEEEFALQPEFAPVESAPSLVRSEAPAAALPRADEPVSIRWDAGLPSRPVEPVEVRAARGQDMFETGAESWWRPAVADPDRIEPEHIEVVEPMAIPANLIEFPRELVATRKARPRLAEGYSSAPEPGTQLSIFEVDPVSLAPEPDMQAAEAAHPWTAPIWSGIELEEEPAQEAVQPVSEALPQVAAVPELEPAPATQRLMALVVDSALVAGSVLAAAMMAASHARTLPGPRAAEICMAVALMLAAGLYQVVFLALGRSTPGMRYARVRLSTFEGLMPNRTQRWKRLAAQLVSVLPVGFGLAWALFDENHLSWHDRLSHTYLCKR